MARNAAGSPKARTLGAELRKHRENAGWTERDLADRIGKTRSMIQRWQRGATVPSSEDVAAFLTACRVNVDERDRVVTLARDVDDGNWLTSDTSGLRSELTTLIECERTCSEIVEVSPLMIPGLLQTPDYITTVMAGRDDVDRRITVRMERQRILTGKNPPRMTAYIAEHALREPTGGHAVMAGQLRHLLTIGAKRHITLRVIPSGSEKIHPSHAGAFVLFRYAFAPPIVHLEHYASPGFVYGVRDVAAYERAEVHLRDAAMGDTDSLRLIAEIAEETERRIT